jgi:galactokinase
MTAPTLPATVRTAATYARSALGLYGALSASWAPGRVNLIGEHTDYNDGWVLPIAIERTVAMVGHLSEAEATTVRLYSVHHQAEATFDLARLPTAQEPQDVPLWARYVAGVLGELHEAGVPLHGFTAAIAGDVPLGGGMSSSAALIVATLTWLNAALQLNQAPLALARMGQRAETRGSGVRVGILDHAASALGQPGQALLIDCRSLNVQFIPFNLPEVALLVCETGVERSLAATGYNDRRAECEAATKLFADLLAQEGDPRAIRALRDLTERDYRRLGGHLPQPLRSRARHVISEDMRTLLAASILRMGETELFGNLLLESHASLRDDYAVSCAELDAVVEIATRSAGSLGARLMGAGFGGSALILAPLDRVDDIIGDLRLLYPQRTGREPTLHRLSPSGGPGTATLA